MERKYLKFALILIVSLSLIGLVDAFSCYQESANVVNQTGIDGICDLRYNGSYVESGIGSMANSYDGDWATYYTSFANSFVFINYTKPLLAVKESSSLWQVKDYSGFNPTVYNLTVPDSCWDYNETELSFYAIIGRSAMYFYCINQTESILLGGSIVSNSQRYYEEAMIWDILNYSIPDITLNSPENNKYLPNSEVYFNFTVIGSTKIDTCELWGNWSGNWALNYSWVAPTNATMNSTSNILPDGFYSWNIWCNNSQNSSWAGNNRSFGIDTNFPNLTLTYFQQIGTTQQVIFNATSSDTADYNCSYAIFNLAGGIDGLNNATIPCNTMYSPSVSAFATYRLFLYAIDLAGNTNVTNRTFTMASEGTATGTMKGGGFLLLPEQNVTKIGTCVPFQNAFYRYIEDSRGKDFFEKIRDGWRTFIDFLICKSSASIVPI